LTTEWPVKGEQKMNRVKHIRLYCLIAIFFSILLGVKNSFAMFTAADLEGTWQLHVLTTSGEWVRASGSIDTSGNLSLTVETSGGDSEEVTDKIIISSNGIMAMTDSPSLQGVMSTDKNFFVMTETWDDEEDEYVLFLAVKQGSGTFIQSDLAGTWDGHLLVSGLRDAWIHETVTIDGVGEFSDLWVDSDGDSGTGTATLVLSNNGIMTVNDWEPMQGVMNDSKNLLVLTNTRTEGICELGIHMKQGGAFSPLDLAGTWIGHTLVVGDWKAWTRSNLAIDTAGNFSFTYVDPDGSSGNDADSLDISDTGIITSENSPAMHGVMNVDKNIIAMTDTWDEDVYAFTVFVKSERTAVSGSISYEGTPLCAMVLANGQYMFTCGDSLGLYDLEVPLDQKSEITLYGFCSGFSPFKAIITPNQAQNFDINMTRAAAGSREIEVNMETEPGTTNPDFIRISGTVTYGEEDLCAMVLANGQNMFSCGADLGTFNLEVPLGANGEITLYAFCSGFAPYKDVFMP
jgi:hypothetical protein